MPSSAASRPTRRRLAVLYTNFTHIVVKDGAGINTIADLKGKRVSVGAANSGTEVIANRILDVNGLDPARGHPARAPRRRRLRQWAP